MVGMQSAIFPTKWITECIIKQYSSQLFLYVEKKYCAPVQIYVSVENLWPALF